MVIEFKAKKPHQDLSQGVWASLTGVLVMAGGFALTSACCWLPTLVFSFGLSTAIASMIGGLEQYAWPIFGFGSVIMGSGIGWMIWRQVKRPTTNGDCCSK
ncbi:hypothetical protein D3C86_1324150 [compost metagenome]